MTLMNDDEIIIGITMGFDDYDLVRPGSDYNYIRREYGEMMRRTGAQPIFLDPSVDPSFAANLCDGILISGGEDIEPDFYDQSDRSGLQKEPRMRTEWERLLIDACDVNEKPVFGICYGSQLLNVHYGGSLHQDIKSELGSSYFHGTSVAPALHTITFMRSFLGFELGDRVDVVSRHHQAVNNLAPGFVTAGTAPDGVVEAITNGRHFGVQWHAESGESGEKLYKAFVERCRRQKFARQRNSDAGNLHQRILDSRVI